MTRTRKDRGNSVGRPEGDFAFRGARITFVVLKWFTIHTTLYLTLERVIKPRISAYFIIGCFFTAIPKK
jgi:hypothetical protein